MAFVIGSQIHPTANPTAEEWSAFAANCNLRDMGTHLCP
jgi:hypothetical protein